jgi:integrase
MGSADGSEKRRATRLIGKLTSLSVRQARRRGLYGDGGGLFLQVSESGAKSWVFRFKNADRLRVMGLGPAHTITLVEARDRARECRKLRLDGIDPIEARRAERTKAKLDAAKAVTFAECADAYITAHKAGWRNPKHAAQWPATLAAYVNPTFGELPVQAIDTALVMKVLEQIWTEKPETASRVRGRIESILDWARARSYREGENPARWRGHLENLLPSRSKVRRVKHHAALPYSELSAFMLALRQQEGVVVRALEFTILTAARTGEVIGARWEEISIAERLWTVPAERMKVGQEHRVPLSGRALEIGEEMQAIGGNFIFPSGKRGKPLSNMAMTMVLRRMGHGDRTVHGFRSTFRDWAAERTNFPAEVAEMALAHAVSDRVEAAYRRGDLFEKRRALAEAWGKFCATALVGDEVMSILKPAAH